MNKFYNPINSKQKGRLQNYLNYLNNLKVITKWKHIQMSIKISKSVNSAINLNFL